MSNTARFTVRLELGRLISSTVRPWETVVSPTTIGHAPDIDAHGDLLDAMT